MLVVKRYTPDKSAEWDAFVALSRNGTFLFMRNYMDYHSERFSDHSLMFYNKSRLCALLPGNVVGATYYSHQGLTYGGLIVGMKMMTHNMVELIESLNEYLQSIGINKVIYKAIPWIYHSYPTEEDLYALHFICKAQIVARHISSAIYLPLRPPLTESRKSGLRKALSGNLRIEECTPSKLCDFWEILSTNLENKYKASPVHSLEEISLLCKRFPSNIKLYGAFDGSKMLGGTLLYLTPHVVHTQYISASAEGKSRGALDLLFDTLLQKDWSGTQYFEFGKSSEGDGSSLNGALLFQKEGFGGRGVVYDWYEWNVE